MHAYLLHCTGMMVLYKFTIASSVNSPFNITCIRTTTSPTVSLCQNGSHLYCVLNLVFLPFVLYKDNPLTSIKQIKRIVITKGKSKQLKWHMPCEICTCFHFYVCAGKSRRYCVLAQLTCRSKCSMSIRTFVRSQQFTFKNNFSLSTHTHLLKLGSNVLKLLESCNFLKDSVPCITLVVMQPKRKTPIIIFN